VVEPDFDGTLVLEVTASLGPESGNGAVAGGMADANVGAGRNIAGDHVSEGGTFPGECMNELLRRVRRMPYHEAAKIVPKDQNGMPTSVGSLLHSPPRRCKPCLVMAKAGRCEDCISTMDLDLHGKTSKK